MCNPHYQRWYRSGTTDLKNMTGLPPEERIRAQSQLTESGCIEWTGKRDRDGYGRLYWQSSKWRAPRLAYTLAHGPIPPGMVIRHRCDNPPCVNVDHLEVGTVSDNYEDMAQRRGRDHLLLGGPASGAKKRAATHCQRSHEFTDKNTYWRNGLRQCKTCRYDAWKRWYARSKSD